MKSLVGGCRLHKKTGNKQVLNSNVPRTDWLRGASRASKSYLSETLSIYLVYDLDSTGAVYLNSESDYTLGIRSSSAYEVVQHTK